ncbi:MAG: adenylate/guanylate cyclase domain-containing protein [Verrucomicrobiota bacterium]
MSDSQNKKKAAYFTAFNLLAPLAALGIFIYLSGTVFFDKFENLTLDQRIKLRHTHQNPIDPRIFLLCVDEGSVEKISQWPFDRKVHAQLMTILDKEKPAVFAWDVMFDTERTNDAQFTESTTLLAQTCASIQTPVITAAAAMDDQTRSSADSLTDMGWDPGPEVINSDLLHSPYFIAPLPELAAHSEIGIVTAERHDDGVVRRIPFIIRGDLQVFPSLALSSIIELWDLDPEKDIRIVPGDAVYIDNPLVQRRIPIDEEGYYTLNYRYELSDMIEQGTAGPYYGMMVGYYAKHSQNDSDVAPPAIKDKIVMIGQVAAGMSDIGKSPLEGFSPMVLTHVNVIDNILKEDYLIVPPKWAVWTVLLVTCYLTFILPIRLDFWIKALVPIATVLVYIVIAVTLFSSSSINLPITGPCLAFLFLHTTGIGQEVFFERRAREELRSTFSAYVAPGILNSIYNNPNALKLGGAKKDVAILFTDIRSFTSMTEVMDSEVLVAQLNEYFTDMVEGINNNGGTLHKFIGDAIMAVWGDISNNSPTMEAGRALQAAIDMRMALDKLNRRWLTQDRPEFKMGVGINFGQVTVGNIGAPQRMEFTVIGDSVNLAARLESLNKKFGTEILVGQSMYELTMERFLFRSIAKVQVVGKSEGVQIYEALCEVDKEEDSPYAMSWVRLYEEGYARFLERRFDVAIRLLEACLNERPNDKTTKLLLETSREFQKTPPEKGWNGTFEMTSK